MQRDMTLEEFKGYLTQYRLYVKEVTPDRVVFDTVNPIINRDVIDYGMSIERTAGPVSVLDCLKGDDRIGLIKIIRYHTGMSISESKALVDSCWVKWVVKYVRGLPFDRLPFEVGRLGVSYGEAVKYRLEHG